MKISYYPGCTLKNHAKNFEDSTICSLKTIGVEVEELDRWNCCGTVFSLTTDDLIHHIAPIRNLIRVKEANYDKVMTVCAMCYNTLKRANERVKSDPDSLEILNNFMDREEIKYEGDVKIFHLLEFLKNEITFENIAKQIVKPLKKLKIASYYGCLLVRPKEIGFDDMENPTILDDLMAVLGADSIDFPYKTECCGAYQTVDNPGIVADRTYQILSSAQDQGAEIVVVSCPLCAFNLDQRQKRTAEKYPAFKNIPVLYFTQPLAIALGCPEETLRFDLNFIDPQPVLREKGLI
ncbi:MAG: CoB--CoM heterodisulfide reductase iron-sulfur subunit B family protein [Candidatus Aminicenantes bacterium]|nr:CoB--CoM heterodisulfide reductase iron-sulfur subunit B family protein [Candidatus Aminicenantes bacterium]MDH5383982.1 CoB--CoM heterodisulfide reductase iron-sulfur subunit B family protein [Candidatus Aminicenantes bacterium]